MIRSRPNGTYYCDGKECGYPLSYMPPDPEDPIFGAEITCLDCWSSMYIAPLIPQTKEPK